MTESTQPHFYQGIGTVEGLLDITPPDYTLTIGEYAFPIHIKAATIKHHRPGEVQRFRVYPTLLQGKPSFNIIGVVKTDPSAKAELQTSETAPSYNCPPPVLPVGELSLHGCWQLYQQQPYFIIYRNKTFGERDRRYRSLISVVWDNAPEPDGQFWQARATVKDGAFVITHAEGPFEPPPRVQDPNHVKLSKPKYTPKPLEPLPPLSLEEIKAMATPVKAQLTCKLTQVPETRMLPDKRLEFFLDDGERILTVKIRQKIFKKLKEHGYDNWIAAISGTIGAPTETGFELNNPSIQVFERKAPTETTAIKDEEAAKTSPEPVEEGANLEIETQTQPAAVEETAKPLPEPVEEQAKANSDLSQQAESAPPKSKRKKLLQGIEVK